MSARRFLLIGLLVALGLCAVTGILALGIDSDRFMWQILWGAITTAAACGLLLPLTLLTDRPKLRLSGIVSMFVIGWLWITALAFNAAQSPTWPHRGRWEDTIAMSFAFTLLMGIPAALVSLLISFRWARFASIAFNAVAGLSWMICLMGAAAEALDFNYFMFARYYRVSEYFLESGLTLLGLGTCACELLINVRCGDRRYFRWVGIACVVVAMVLFLVGIWVEPWLGGGHLFRNTVRVAFECMLAAIVMGHINLLLMARLRESQVWLRRLTIIVAILGGIMAAPIPMLDYSYRPLMEILIRISVAIIIATACGSVAHIVLSMLNRKPAAQLVPGALTATAVTLICPRCQSRQTLAFGDATCKNCELQISIKVTEPRCPGCGYLLYQLTSPKCPECGAQIRENEAAPPMVAAS